MWGNLRKREHGKKEKDMGFEPGLRQNESPTKRVQWKSLVYGKGQTKYSP